MNVLKDVVGILSVMSTKSGGSTECVTVVLSLVGVLSVRGMIGVLSEYDGSTVSGGSTEYDRVLSVWEY